MIPLTVAHLAEITGAVPGPGVDPAVVVTGPVVIDSRRAGPGGLFAALSGQRADGHDFARDAVAAGAAAVLASRPCGVPALLVPDVPAALAALARAVVDRLPGLAIVGITGSAGKTTTKDLAAQLIESLGPTVSPQNSYNNEIGHPLTVLRVTDRTAYLVSELSARAQGDIARLCAIAPPRLGAVLCVGHAHAGEFGGIEQVARAKAELVAALPADGVAVLNADDPRVLAMAGSTAARVVTFGRSPGADVRAEDVVLDDAVRPGFTLVTAEGSAPVRLRLHGEHNVANALAAAALAGQLGMGVAEAAARLSAATSRSRWRMEVTERADGVTVINDAYNASPDAVAAALDALAAMTRGTLGGRTPGESTGGGIPGGHTPGESTGGGIPGGRPPGESTARRAFAVLGYMAELGAQEREFHERAGRLAARAGLAGLIVVGERAAPMLDGAKAESSWHGELVQVPDPAAAVAAVQQRVRHGDVVLVKAARVAGLQTVAQALTGEQPLTGKPSLAGERRP